MFSHFSLRRFAVYLVLALPSLVLGQPAPKHAMHSGETAESHLGKGYEALQQDSYSAAAAEFRAALRIDPTLTLRARFPLAVALFELHQSEESRREFVTIRHNVGDHSNVLYYLGRLDLEQRNFADAVANLKLAAEKPPFPDTAYYLGFAYFRQGSLAEAESWLNQAALATPQDARVLYQLAQVYRKGGHEAQAREALRRSEQVRQRGSKDSELRLECARKLDQGPREDAHAFCDQLYDPNDAAKLTALGTIYGQHGELEAALKPLQRAAELEPESPQSQYNIALLKFQLNRAAEAREPLAKAVARWPDLFPLNSLYGSVLAKLDDHPAAYPVLQRAHLLNPHDKPTEDLLFLTALALGRKSQESKAYEPALRYYLEASGIRPQEASPHEAMADVYTLKGQVTRAASEARLAKRLRRESGRAK